MCLQVGSLPIQAGVPEWYVLNFELNVQRRYFWLNAEGELQ